MSINACSINSFTIDAGKCRSRFQDLVTILHPARPTSPKVSNGGWTQQRPPRIYHGINAPRWDDEQVPNFTELDRVTVSVSVFGIEGSDTQQIQARPDLVTVTDIEIISAAIDVNITDLQVN